MKTAAEKDYNIESDIPMNDAEFNIGQMVKQSYDANEPKPMRYMVQDVSWSVLENSWVYGVSEFGPEGCYWPDVLQKYLLPL